MAAAKWLYKITKEEVFNDFLAKHSIRWQFSLSKALWWGGQFERMVGLVKQAFYRTVGGANLKWDELQDVLLDYEIALDNHPLSYVEDDVQLPILTQNVMMFGQPNLLPEEPVELITEKDMKKRARYLNQCKDALWLRWTGEYLRALRERHVMKNNKSEVKLKAGDIVLIKGEERNRGKWNIGIVEEMIIGRDGIVRVVKLRAGKSHLEQPIQHLYLLELEHEARKENRDTKLNAGAHEFRPRQNTAQEGKDELARIAMYEHDKL